MDLSRLIEIDREFERLLDTSEPDRAAALDAIRSQDAGLAQLLERLLDVADTAQTDALRDGVVPADADAEIETAWPVIPGYQITSELGRGGMARVFSAIRTVHDAQQRVALKILDARRTDARSRVRFVREQRILATLAHPGIAALVDAGDIEGRPWLAMEQIDGQPIDRCFTPEKSSVPAIVQAVAQIADAVQAAHERLIVHRDIKPENVLVDDAGRIKLIDFGIAAPLDGIVLPKDRATETGSVPLTLRYASPEQLRNEPVGVASDVYQIGLLLFHLLTGRWPYDEGEGQLPVARMRDQIPPRRASQSVADRALARRLAGDLDAILGRCLSSNPQERYRSAHELQLDLLRHLESRPVHARRWSRTYLTRAFMRRHRVGVTIAASLALALVVATVSAWQIIQRERAHARQSERMLALVVEVMNDSDPYVAGASLADAEAAMQHIRERVRNDADIEPVYRARMLTLLASIHGRRGQNEDERQLLEDALRTAEDNALGERQTAEIALALARALTTLSRTDEALEVMNRHAAILEKHESVPTQVMLARIENRQGDVVKARQRLESRAAQLTDPLDIGERSLLNQLAIIRGNAGDRNSSIEAAERAFHGLVPANGAEVASWLTYGLNLATAYGEARRYREADELHAQMSDWTRERLGREHPQLTVLERSRATGLARVARYREALDILQPLSDTATRQEQPLQREGFLRLVGIAQLYSGKHEEALMSLFAALDVARVHPAVPGSNQQYHTGAETLAWALVEAGHYSQAYDVARGIPNDQPRKHVRAAMIRILAPLLGVQAEVDPQDRQLVASSQCLNIELAYLEAAIQGKAAPSALELPATCDGAVGPRVLALGGKWTPDWAADFPPQLLDSALLARLRTRDLAPIPPSEHVAAALEAWRRPLPGSDGRPD